MVGSEKKRRNDRVRLYAPITAFVDEQRITVLDVSEIGARVEHNFPLKTGSETRINFSYEDKTVDLDCEVVRCKLEMSVMGGTPSYSSGLRFKNQDDPSIAALLEMLRKVVSQDFDARKKYATKKRPPRKKAPKA